MKITLKEPRLDIGLSELKPGDFFRLANGANTKTPFLVLGSDAAGYNRWITAREIGTDKIRKLWITNKERRVTLLEITEITFCDMPAAGRLEAVEAEDLPDEDGLPAVGNIIPGT